MVDRYGRTALHLASSEGHLKIISILIANHANPNILDIHGHEPLFDALLNGHQDVAEELISIGSELSVESRGELEGTIIHKARFGIPNHKAKLTASGFSLDSIPDLDIWPDSGISSMHENDYSSVERSDPSPSCVSNPIRPASQKTCEAALAKFTLLTACPAPIAAARLRGLQPPPLSRENASVLVSDIVGFTSLSATLGPAAVARALRQLFSRLDRLAGLHGVQKVDVIGDAYVAATNLTEDQPHDHAARLARFALDAAAAAEDVLVDGLAGPDDGAAAGPRRRLRVRVGLHCGPVAAVVAAGGLRYALLGEAARGAARMEATGAAGRVHCSAAAAKLLMQQAPDLRLRPRGPPGGPLTAYGPGPGPGGLSLGRLGGGSVGGTGSGGPADSE